MADAQAPLRAARSRPDRRSRLPLPGSLQAQLRRPRRPPPEGRGAFKPKGLSHEEKLPAPPPRRGLTPLHEAHDSGHVTGAPPGAAVEGGAVGRRDSARTVSRGVRGQRPRPAPPRPGGSYQRERHGVRRGPEGLTGGQAGGRVSAARDAHTRGHYFCSERRATPRPGGRLYKAPPRWPDEEHLCRPRPASPPPPPPALPTAVRTRAPPPTLGLEGGRG